MNIRVALALILFSLATAGSSNAQTSASDSAVILTPKPGPSPRINGPKVFGVRPGHPIVFTIPATGTRPIEFSADKIPAGVQLDKKTGRLSGSIASPGEYAMILHARNKSGRSDRAIKIV